MENFLKMMLNASFKENHEVFVIFLSLVINWCPHKYLFIFTIVMV